MQTVKDILEPSKEFTRVSEAYKQNVDDLFNNLVKQSNVDINANKATCDEIYATQAQQDKAKKKKTGTKVGKGFSIAGAVIGFLVMVIGIVILATNRSGQTPVAAIVMLVVGLLVGVGLTLLICLVLNKSIKKSTATINELEAIIKQKTDEAWKQMQPLNALFTWNMPQTLISDTVPLIQLDRFFYPKRFWQLVDQYGLKDHGDENESVVCVQSGQILGNPFVFEKTFFTYMGNYTYTGTLVITWTTTSTDSNGHTHTVTHTQTLVAHVTKPKPYYEYSTNLIYGNSAAPDLTFSRGPAKIDAGNVSEKKLQKYIKKQTKKLDKMTEQALKKGNTFTKMENNEFETLFNCTDRDHEQQFRLLFTPIGQTNMVSLLKSSPYGDDFEFSKYHMINVIHSQHSQQFDYHSAPWLFQRFDFEELQNNFKSYFANYLQSLYFDLAPILSIPLYQQHKAHDYIWHPEAKSNLTYHEVESLCNYFGADHFAHPDTVTDVILKSEYAGKSGGIDELIIHAYSYRSIPHTELVPVMGGDGHMHAVPVVWYEYIPLHNATNIKAYDWQGYEEANKDKKGNFAQDFKVSSSYGQKGLGISV